MWGWWVVTAFTCTVGLSMSELASAYPTSGALYYWSYMTAPRRCDHTHLDPNMAHCMRAATLRACAVSYIRKQSVLRCVHGCRCRVLTCWLTGWMLLLGQTAFTASNVYTLVSLLTTIVEVAAGVTACAHLYRCHKRDQTECTRWPRCSHDPKHTRV